jgi:mono/diheme cytochrome c family protein
MQVSLSSIRSNSKAAETGAWACVPAFPHPGEGMAAAVFIVAAAFLAFPPGAIAQQQQTPEASSGDIDGETMFATSCGFCHEDGGRAEGKGPKLSNSTRSDAYIIDRIKKGKAGAMPAFGRVFSEGQIMAILAYIRGLDE